MTDTQLFTIALMTIPTMVTVMIGILYNNSRQNDLREDLRTSISNLREELRDNIAELRPYMDLRFGEVERRFDAVDQSIAASREIWRAELGRVEEILDARLKHLEQS